MKINDTKYYSLEDYLICFNPNVYSDNEGKTLSEKEVLDLYLKSENVDKEYISEALKQCREVLSMDPFPWEQIADTADRTVWNEKTQKWDGDDPKSYHKWLMMVTDMLELEAKKQGKL